MRQKKRTRINQRVGLLSIVIIILVATLGVYMSLHRHPKLETHITYQETRINLPQSADELQTNHKTINTL